MSTKEVVVDRVITASPSASYLAVWLAGIPIDKIVALLTGVAICLQIVKSVLELRDRRKAKEQENAKQ